MCAFGFAVHHVRRKQTCRDAARTHWKHVLVLVLTLLRASTMCMVDWWEFLHGWMHLWIVLFDWIHRSASDFGGCQKLVVIPHPNDCARGWPLPMWMLQKPKPPFATQKPKPFFFVRLGMANDCVLVSDHSKNSSFPFLLENHMPPKMGQCVPYGTRTRWCVSIQGGTVITSIVIPFAV